MEDNLPMKEKEVEVFLWMISKRITYEEFIDFILSYFVLTPRIELPENAITH